jgi:geranylgeranyl pyrophosphate synthase
MLILRAMRLAGPGDRHVLRRILGDDDLGQQDAERARGIVRGTGALDDVEALIVRHREAASHALAPVPAPARAALESLADCALYRRS